MTEIIEVTSKNKNWGGFRDLDLPMVNTLNIKILQFGIQV
jgi:hypothetical protein